MQDAYWQEFAERLGELVRGQQANALGIEQLKGTSINIHERITEQVGQLARVNNRLDKHDDRIRILEEDRKVRNAFRQRGEQNIALLLSIITILASGVGAVVGVIVSIL